VQKVLDAGYVDTLHEFDPHASETAGSFNTQSPGQRVDYVFAYGFGPGQTKRAWVDHSPRAKDASDHYPVGADVL
jgi:endonuclease/exonuclease/phosphatase family metal-dependent hydrolase